MKELIVRSPGRTPKRGKKQPGIMTRKIEVLESTAAFTEYVENNVSNWVGQCEIFEKCAQQYMQGPTPIQPELTVRGIAEQVLVWTRQLRDVVATNGPAPRVAFVALSLAGRMIELVTLLKEQALLVGDDQISRPKQAGIIPKIGAREIEWARWKVEANRIRKDQPKLKSESRIAELVKARLRLGESKDTIRKRI